MSLEGNRIAAGLLEQGVSGAAALTAGIKNVEDNPGFHSVGYSGLPDRDGHVTLDGGFMDGDTLRFGAVGSLEGFASPIEVARSLKDYEFNNFLVGHGAERYAREHQFEERDNLTKDSEARWRSEQDKDQRLVAYDGHDTVCFLTLDQHGTVSAGVSTSGLYLKREGRLGDSPVIGSGFYADSKVGGAAATGVGEEIMKGALSHTAYMYMKLGLSAQEAADKALFELDEALRTRNGSCNAISLIVMDREGKFGVSTNIVFPFAYASSEHEPSLYLARADHGKTIIEQVEDISTVTLD
ncbi:MAG: isoaspartyl peptidase/L-asparaginase [Solobacterium sp.]|nr:isoaspartyl peptidase/L-asparaginase [Solobacterium sp.]